MRPETPTLLIGLWLPCSVHLWRDTACGGEDSRTLGNMFLVLIVFFSIPNMDKMSRDKFRTAIIFHPHDDHGHRGDDDDDGQIRPWTNRTIVAIPVLWVERVFLLRFVILSMVLYFLLCSLLCVCVQDGFLLLWWWWCLVGPRPMFGIPVRSSHTTGGHSGLGIAKSKSAKVSRIP